MKKYCIMLLCALLVTFAWGAFAQSAEEYEAMVEPDYEHNAVVFRIPKGWDIYSANEEVISELTSGEEDEDSFVQMFSPTEGGEGVGEIRFGPKPEQDAETAVARFEVAKDGSLAYISLTVFHGKEENPYVTLSEDKTTLTVKLRGNPTTGYEWTYYPDNSGTMSLIADTYTPDEVPEGFVGGGGTYIWKSAPSEGNIPGNQGSLLFLHERSFEGNSCVSKMCVHITLSEDLKTISDFSSEMTVYY